MQVAIKVSEDGIRVMEDDGDMNSLCFINRDDDSHEAVTTLLSALQIGVRDITGEDN
jgi:hypothetical protein